MGGGHRAPGRHHGADLVQAMLRQPIWWEEVIVEGVTDGIKVFAVVIDAQPEQLVLGQAVHQ